MLKRGNGLLAFIRELSSTNLKEMSMSNSQKIIWMDLEMTGLDVKKDKILEVACVITDGELNIISKFPSIIIHENDEVLKDMNDWSLINHAESGLTEASKKSKVSLQETEMKLLSFVQRYTVPNHCPLAGNSIYQDKKFIEKYMPKLFQHFHYRIIDVSSLKELCRRWYPTEFSGLPQKKYAHRASDDIDESIEELKYYRKHMFKSSEVI